MKAWLRNFLLINKKNKSGWCFLILVAFFSFNNIQAQVINYVNNPGFEMLIPNHPSNFDAAEFWGPIDTAQNSYVLFSTLNGSAPYCSTGFQYPRAGSNFILSQFFCTACPRWYPRNRLKQFLKPNTSYCAKYYVVNTNNNRVAIENYALFAGDYTTDTITQCTSAITYLNPQIENASGIITDTLNWTPITGTFVANGTEKYLFLGNFKSNAATNTLLINPPLQVMGNDVYIDDVSLIELDLPAFAGYDYYLVPGDSAFIGRQPDVGINEACIWHQSPNLTVPFDTIAGMYVKPAVTTTYVVRQDICGNVKWDTVIVFQSALGIDNLKFISDNLNLYPVPANDELNLAWSSEVLVKKFTKAAILNDQGQNVLETNLNYNDKNAALNIKELPDGIYIIRLFSSDVSLGTISRRFVVNK